MPHRTTTCGPGPHAAPADQRPPSAPEGRARRLLAGVALALGCVTAAPGLAQEGGFGPQGAVFVLRAMGRCLEVSEAQLQVEGARVQLQRCEGRPNQTWRHERGRLVNVANGRCLDVHGPDAGFDGARVQTVACSAAPNQQWRRERGLLIVRVDDRCLEGQGLESTRPPPTVQTWSCDGERAQRWRVSALPQTPPSPPPATVPPAVRDVEAGPLFSNAEAARKCPAVCSPGRWNGQWATTVPGRMSVCGCAFEAPAGPPPTAPMPPPPPPAPGDQAMAPERFDALVRAIDDEAFAADGLRTLQMAARDQRFSVAQVLRLFELFPFGSDRLRALEVAAPRLSDRGNAFQLLGAFTFDSEKAQARQIIERGNR